MKEKKKMAEDEVGSTLVGTPADDNAGNWTDGFEEPIKEHMLTKGYEDSAALANAYVNLEKTIGADKMTLPAADADLMEWDGWHKLGTPADPEDYDLAAPDGYEGYDTNTADWFREAAHGAKVPAPMAQRLHDAFVERQMAASVEQQEAATAQQDAWEDELKTKYGTAFDERVSQAKSALNQFGGDELRTLLNQNGMGSHPVVVDALSKIGIALGSGPQFKDAESSGQFGTTPDMAKEQIATLRAHPAMYDKSHAEHKLVNEKLTRLNELAYGTDLVVKSG
jgi:hypothetical protein|tara:strand:+ start:232 stop:1074 length:843 start_codon:yes stop_codon:yes gene_type:complete